MTDPLVWTGILHLRWVGGTPDNDYHSTQEWKHTEVRLVRVRTVAKDEFVAEYVTGIDRFGVKQWRGELFGHQYAEALKAALRSVIDNAGLKT